MNNLFRSLLRKSFSPVKAFVGSLEAARTIRQPCDRLFFDVVRSFIRSALQMACLVMGFRGYWFAFEKGGLFIELVTGLIHDEPTVAKLVERTVEEARTV